MKNIISCLVVVGLTLSALSPVVAADAGDAIRVRVETSAGAMIIELYPDKAPTTVSNFLRYVDGGHYKGASFYRTVTFENDNGKPWIEVIQGGIGDKEPPFDPIAHESTATSGLRHQDGTISMARGDVGSAAGEFFICIGAQPGLDHGALRNPDGQGFAAFGRVVAGMDTVRRIHNSDANGPTDSAYVAGQILTEPVRIISVRRLDSGDDS